MFRVCVLLIAAMASLCSHQARADLTLSKCFLLANPGQQVSCTCTVSGGETFNGWFKGNNSITTTTNATVHVVSSGDKHKLKFTQVGVSDGGSYECRGSFNTEKMNLKVFYEKKTSCSGASPTLGDGCTISDDCSKITCEDFVKKSSTFTLKVNKCDEPVTVTASMDVTDQYVTWSHTFTSDDISTVPGFTVYGRPISVQVNYTYNGDNLHLKVQLLFKGKSSYLVKATVMDGDLPNLTDNCGGSTWWDELSLPAKVAVIAGSIVLVLGFCCCYGWSRQTRSSSSKENTEAPKGDGDSDGDNNVDNALALQPTPAMWTTTTTTTETTHLQYLSALAEDLGSCNFVSVPDTTAFLSSD